MTWDANAPGSFWIDAGKPCNVLGERDCIYCSGPESVHVSLLSGRVMLRDVKYYSANQTIRAVRCYVTWRYWLWRARDRNESEPDGPEEGARPYLFISFRSQSLI
jgi:hypothetical protein